MAISETLWTVDDCAAFLKVEASKVKFWIRCAQLPTIRLGRQIRFDPKDVLEWVNSRKNHKAQPRLRAIE